MSAVTAAELAELPRLIQEAIRSPSPERAARVRELCLARPPNYDYRKAWLLVCSYLFYANWDWRFLSLIWISTALDYVVGLRLLAVKERRVRRWWLIASLVGNLGILGFFKYYNFFIDSAMAVARAMEIPVSLTTLEIILPAGISFYTFQTMSYAIDVYRNKLHATRNLLDFALFVAFFPQLVAGPIVRAVEFLPQLRALKKWSDIDAKSCLVLFLFGYIKKACIADNLAPLTEAFYAHPEAYSAAGAVAGHLGFVIQIFCDFAGYSEMAIGSAGLLGYALPDNFRFPYFSGNIQIFWSHWHMTLSRWIFDYLFAPLMKYTRLPFWVNFPIVFSLIGLWHGANWTFVIWGTLHGVVMVAHRIFSKSVSRNSLLARGFGLIGPVLTFYWFYVVGVLFRSSDLYAAWSVFQAAVLLQSAGTASFHPAIWGIFAGLALVHWIAYRKLMPVRWESVNPWLFSVAYGAVFSLALALSNIGYEPFYYFRF